MKKEIIQDIIMKPASTLSSGGVEAGIRNGDPR